MKISLQDEQTMKTLGRTLGRALQGGEFFELIGDVGAGKTTFTKALAEGLGITEPIQSPTFTISNRYESPRGVTLVHYDFYRLQDAGIMQDELREVVDDSRAVTVIEWGDIVADVVPDDRLTITITPTSESARDVEIVAHGARAQQLIEVLA